MGKTHFAIALGDEAIVAGYSVYFVTVQELVAQFQRASDANKLKERMTLLIKPKLLILDEMGYLVLDSFAATCMFQLVSERYEKGATKRPGGSPPKTLSRKLPNPAGKATREYAASGFALRRTLPALPTKSTKPQSGEISNGDIWGLFSSR